MTPLGRSLGRILAILALLAAMGIAGYIETL